MADSTWQRFPEVGLVWASTEAGADLEVTFAGEPEAYRPRDKRQAIARAFLDIQNIDTAIAFCQRWGPPRTAVAHAEGLAQRAELADRSGGRENVRRLAQSASRARGYREATQSTDAAWQRFGDEQLVGIVRKMGLVFDPGGGLVPQLHPFSLLQLVAVALLEEARAIGPVLQCMNWPAPGCLRDVPPPGPRGRRPLYCSPRCAERAQSRRSYARRKLRRSQHGEQR